MDWLFDLMDLPENLQRGLTVARPIRGAAAAIMGSVLLALCYLMWPWLWYFDIESTQVWTAMAMERLNQTIHGAGIPFAVAYTENVAWIVTGTTFLPTLVELFTVRFALGGIKAARILVVFFATFDLVTDFPRVAEFIDSFGLGALGWLLKLPLLLLASFGLQSLFIIFLVTGFALMLSARRPAGRGYAGAAASTIDM